jgi:hypothetical protein
MQDILLKFQPVESTTWVYLSSLLILALFCKFNRIWSLRNFDLIGLILLAPGLVVLDYGLNRHQPIYEKAAYVWLFCVTGLLLIRMLIDNALVRRPLLEPNLSLGGMIFLLVALMVFFTGTILTKGPSPDALVSSRSVAKPMKVYKAEVTEPTAIPPLPPPLNQQFQKQDQPESTDNTTSTEPKPEIKAPDVEQPIAADTKPKTDEIVAAAQQKQNEQNKIAQRGPGFWLVNSLPSIATPIFADENSNRQAIEDARNTATSKTVLIFSHFAIVFGMILIGHLHFSNVQAGVAASLLYLLMPYTIMYVGWVQHILPAAFLVWAVVAYRRPLLSGALIGLASGTVYYPVFLLPLWISFYWKRGLFRFLIGLGSMLGLLVIVTAFNANGWDDFLEKLQLMTGFMFPTTDPKQGFWRLLDENFRIYRITILAAHIALAGSFAIWPVQKNLGTLLCCSAAILLSTQFWAAYGGGDSMAWYLPFLLLTIFRPNLEDRVAVSVLKDGWLTRPKLRINPLTKAA